MSTIVGNIVIKVQDVHPDIPAEQIARALALICGAVLLFVGLIRCGWIVEFIPLVTITSFMTGAAISIAVGQVPSMMGITGVNTREASYKVFINTLKALPRSRLDAALGLSALFLLYAIRWFCDFMSSRQPNKKKMWFFISTLRMTFIILLYTMISWLVNRGITSDKDAKFRILGTVPKGRDSLFRIARILANHPCCLQGFDTLVFHTLMEGWSRLWRAIFQQASLCLSSNTLRFRSPLDVSTTMSSILRKNWSPWDSRTCWVRS